MVNARMLKELQSLAPWTWDKKCEKHPPGTKSLHDFERVEHYGRWPQPTPEGSKKSGRSTPKAEEDPRPSKKHKGELQDSNQTPRTPAFPPRTPVAATPMTATPEPSSADTRAAPPSSYRPASASSSYSSGPSAGSSIGRPAITPGIAMSTPRVLSAAHMAPAQRDAVMPRRLSLSELPNKKDPKAPSPQQQQEAPAMPAPEQKQQKVKMTMAAPPKPLQPKRQKGLEAPGTAVEEAAKKQPVPQKLEPSSMAAPPQKQQKVKITMAAPPKQQQKGLEAPQGTKQQQRDAKTAANNTGSAQMAPPSAGSVSKESGSKAPKAPPVPSVRIAPSPATAAAKKTTTDTPIRDEGPAAALAATEVPAKMKPLAPPVSLGSTKARKEAAPGGSSNAAVKKSSGASRPEGTKRIITVGARSVSASAAGTATKKPLSSSSAPARKIITFSGAAAPLPEKPTARPQPSLIRSSIPPLFMTPSAAPQPRQQQQPSAATAAPQRTSKGPAAAEMPPPPPVRPSGKARAALQVESKHQQRPPVAALGHCCAGEGAKEGNTAALLSKAPLTEAPSASSAPRPADALRDITNSSPGEKQGRAWPLFVQRQPPSEKSLVGQEAACSSSSSEDDSDTEQAEEHAPLHPVWTAGPPPPMPKMAATAFSTELWPKTVPIPIEHPETMKRAFAALRMLDAREGWMY